MLDARESSILDQAISWHVRLQDATEEQWQEFAAWLDEDPSHNQAYEAVADEDTAIDIALEQLTPPEVAANDDEFLPQQAPRASHWRWGALAATVALVVGVGYATLGGQQDGQRYVTGAGETRIVALDDGSQIALNGGTEIVLSGDGPRLAELKSGEAHFEIRHDPRRRFTVVMGAQKIVDIGTIFNIVRDSDGIRLEVAEGSVRYEGFGKSLDMQAGATLVATGGGKITSGRKTPALIGSWIRGELVYRDADLTTVARDLQRSSGKTIAVAPGLAEQRFTGVIQTRGDKDQLRNRIEGLLGVHVSEAGESWTLEN